MNFRRDRWPDPPKAGCTVLPVRISMRASGEDEVNNFLKPILATEVEKWFRDFGAKHWTVPGPQEIDAFCELLELLRTSEADNDLDNDSAADPDAFQPLDPNERFRRVKDAVSVIADGFPRLISAAALLSRELPRLTEIGKKAVATLQPVGVDPIISETQLHILECLLSAALASEDAFRAPLFQVEKSRQDPRSEWHATAKVIANSAREVWCTAGNKNVGIGQDTESPVVKLTQVALERLGLSQEQGTIRQMLYDWHRKSRPVPPPKK
jgi:hypothetical protein